MGPYLTTPIKLKKIKSDQWDQEVRFQWAASAMQGWRNTMEDSEICEMNIDGQGTHIFGVFDGHGGAEVALFVENHFVAQLKLLKSFQNKDFKKSLTEIFYKMDDMLQDQQYHAELKELQECSGKPKSESFAGCTANVALIHKNMLYVANAGDSRSCLGKKYEGLLQMSFDHKPENEEEKQRVEKAGGFVTENRVNGNLNLSRAIGDLEYKNQPSRQRDQQLIIVTPDITEVDLSKNEYQFLLMGCDGIWETKEQEVLIDYIRKNLQQQVPIQQLINQFIDDHMATDVTKGIGCDNMSAILLNFY